MTLKLKRPIEMIMKNEGLSYWLAWGCLAVWLGRAGFDVQQSRPTEIIRVGDKNGPSIKNKHELAVAANRLIVLKGRIMTLLSSHRLPEGSYYWYSHRNDADICQIHYWMA